MYYRFVLIFLCGLSFCYLHFYFFFFSFCFVFILIFFGFFFFFFFSSRRRHTRSLCDWSSDVCSSDLFRPDICFLVRYVERATDEPARHTSPESKCRAGRRHEPLSAPSTHSRVNGGDRKSVV